MKVVIQRCKEKHYPNLTFGKYYNITVYEGHCEYLDNDNKPRKITHEMRDKMFAGLMNRFADSAGVGAVVSVKYRIERAFNKCDDCDCLVECVGCAKPNSLPKCRLRADGIDIIFKEIIK